MPEFLYTVIKCNPHERAEGPKFLPWAMSSCVFNKYPERSPPFHLTAEDTRVELDNYRIKPTFITIHRISRGLGGNNAIQYFINRDEVSAKTWEHETNSEQRHENTEPIRNNSEI